MNKTQAIKTIRSGKIFSCEFTKKDGSVRKLNGRTGVKSKKGGELNYSPSDQGYINVFDLKLRDYRTVNIQTLYKLNGKSVN